MQSSISQVFTRYCDAHRGVKKAQTLNHTGTAIALLEQFLSETGRSLRMTEFTATDAEAWRSWMVLAEKWEASTINSYLRSTAPVCRWASRGRNRVIEENPFQDILYLPEEHEVMEFTNDEIRAMLDKASPYWRAFIVLAVGSGLTRGELLNLGWRDVVCDEGLVWVRRKSYDPKPGGTLKWVPKKRGGAERRPVQLALSAEAEAVLEPLEFGRAGYNPYIFIPDKRYVDLRVQGLRVMPDCPVSSINRQFDALLRRAKVPKTVRGTRRYIHTFRATYITKLTRLIGKVPGHDFGPQDVQAAARHSTWKTTSKYAALNTAALAAIKGRSITGD